MHTYNQSNGYWSQNGKLLGQGYSGHQAGVNNPALEQTQGIGPIPRGRWFIGAEIAEHPHLGPMVMPLVPLEGTETFGRGGFFIHGDEIGHVGEEIASHGCIILGRDVRDAIAASDDSTLEVV